MIMVTTVEPGSEHHKLYEERLAKISDEDFTLEEFCIALDVRPAHQRDTPLVNYYTFNRFMSFEFFELVMSMNDIGLVSDKRMFELLNEVSRRIAENA